MRHSYIDGPPSCRGGSGKSGESGADAGAGGIVERRAVPDGREPLAGDLDDEAVSRGIDRGVTGRWHGGRSRRGRIGDR